MTLQEQIKKDMVIAMKEKKQDELALLRVVSGEFSRIGKDLSDEQSLNVLRKMSQNAKELSNDYEVKILEKYLPQMLDENQIISIVSEILIKNSFSSMNDMGKVMGKIKSRPDASQIDGKLSSKIVKEMLAK